ncbi:MAG: ABC transporter permease [Armatimonadetes bacterium]|nr:ABC transporter permease [Armatimonadota bacterium]
MHSSPLAAVGFGYWQPRVRLLLVPGGFFLLTVFLLPVAYFLAQGFHGFSRGAIQPGWTTATVEKFVTDPFYWGFVLNSFILGAAVTVITLLAAYPAALIMVHLCGTRLFWITAVAVFSPLLTSIIVRSYGWLFVLSDSGVVNWLLMTLGLSARPVRLIFNWTGTIVAMVHIEMPFMLFPILSVLMQLPKDVKESAQDLGANAFQCWARVVLPLSLPGVLAGCQVVFTTSISAFASPTILGGGRVRVLPVAIYSNIQGLNWPLGAVESLMLLALSLLLVTVFTRLMRTRGLWAGGGR